MGNDSSINWRITLVVLAAGVAGCATTEEVPEPQPEPVIEAAPVEPAPEPVALQPDAPLRYVVQKGDTLWSISNRYLKDSWQWPELWYVNPKVQNPHLIYPGDVLYLYYVNGRPQLARAGETPAAPGEERPAEVPAEPPLPPGGQATFSPRVREQPLDQAIFAIPLETISAFLRGPRLIDEDELDDAPYIVDFEEDHLIAGNDTLAYVLELEDPNVSQYQVVRRGAEYRDPDDNDVIGYEVMPAADAEVRVHGDPATVYLRRSDMETRPGDYLLPLEQDPLTIRFVPHAPRDRVDGRIISVHNGLSRIGQYQIIAINRGTEHGMEPGHVLTVMQTGRVSKDPYSFFGSSVQLPDIKAGTVMVFKTAPRLSYALVMSATREIHLLDKVEKPDLAQ